MARPARTLNLLDCIGIGVNGIVGSGIYLLIARLSGAAGQASVLGILACGVLCILIALCFAELSSMFDRNGGPYVYARAAFGPFVGFIVGWMSMATGVLAFAAVAVAFADSLVGFVPWVGATWLQLGALQLTYKQLVAGGLILLLGTINYLNVKAGARTSDLLSVLKLAPLFLLALVGLFHVKADVLSGIFSAASIPAGPEGAPQGYFGAVSSSAFIAVFMLSGFEFVSVPAGEAKESRRNIPIAIVGSLMGATLLYCVLQVIALSVVPGLSGSATPLVDTAAAVFGPKARAAFLVAALISMTGFCAGSALVAPRYFTAMAEDGYLPRRLTTLSRFATPGPATIVATLLSLLLALVMGFASLVDVSNVALFAQYVPTAIAVIVLRRKLPHADRIFRLPGGPLIPLLAAGASLVLLWSANTRVEEWIFSGQVIGGGLLVWALSVLARRWFSKPAPTGVQG